MSKSYNNAIYLSDTPDVINKKVARMVTDPQRMRRSDPGNPDICNVYEFHRIYSGSETWEAIAPQCRKAEIGCVECKKIMAEALVKALEPVREKRQYYEARPDEVEALIIEGSDKARRVARQTMEEVRHAVNI
jgi:tryptophanyl-tRNA synthetase